MKTVNGATEGADGSVLCSSVSPDQKLLCEKLEEQLHSLDSALKKRERAERR